MKIRFGFSLKLEDIENHKYKNKYFSFTKECIVVPRVNETVCLGDDWLECEVKTVYYILTSKGQEVCVNLRDAKTWNEVVYEELYNDAVEFIKEFKNE